MPFINSEFLLENRYASRLYHDFAESQPIIDYHCHLDPADVSNDRTWENITQLWLSGDHYKWRAMRSNGIPERYCTGDAPDRDKFQKFAETMPYLLKNPMYHWCHLELARYFDIDDLLLSGETADEVWDRTGEILNRSMSARQLMCDSNVVLICTTDDPIDSLEHHKRIQQDPFGIQMFPTWRPDRILAIEKPGWGDYLRDLEQAADMEICTYDNLVTALQIRHEFFHNVGCRLSDHSLEGWSAPDFTDSEIRAIFRKAYDGAAPAPGKAEKFKFALMLEFGRMDAARGWTKQLHIGALRNTNSRMFRQLGGDLGFDSIDDRNIAHPLSRYLDRLDDDGNLPKMILYNLNPRDNEMMAAMIGNFQDGSTAGKIQLGSGWWFMDQKDGIERHIEALSQLGLLRRFVGMLTDSRSFLSYTRHEYFRRVLCNILGKDMKRGLLPSDFSLIGSMVEDICFGNASRFFGFEIVY